MEQNFKETIDFMNDPGFIAWALKTGDSGTSKWDKWIAENPDKESLAEEAAVLIRLMQFREPVLPAKQVEKATARLFEAIRSGRQKASSRVFKMKFNKIWYAAAAVLLIGIIIVSIKLTLHGIPRPQLATTYGQIRQDKLPDGTEVTLNANSKLTYPKIWKEGTDREVWINGEAFFHVKKTVTHDKFIVHTDAFDIEVTGTSFNVVNRKDISTVILKEGSVKIHRPGGPEIIMVPGDFIGFSNEQIQKKTITKTDYLAWTENRLVFDNTPIRDVAAIIKEHYGVDVKLQGNNIHDKSISGMMPNNNLDVLLKSLEAALDVEIIHDKDLITIIDKTNN